MRPAQVHLRELKSVFRRRWPLFLAPLVLVTALGVLGAFMLPRMYESSTTLLIRMDETLNPLSGWDLVNALEDQMRNYNEIIRSRTFIQTLVDSLGLDEGITTEEARVALLASVGESIQAERRSSDTFTLTYADSDPVRAQRAAQTASKLFINTKLQFELRRNRATVEYFEGKVREYRGALEASAKTLVSAMRQNIDEAPAGNRMLYAQVDELERAVGGIRERARDYENALVILRTLPGAFRSNRSAMRTESGKQPLLELTRSDIPFATELRTLVGQYDQASRRYTGKYPEVQQLEEQIIGLLERMRQSVESELYRQQEQLATAERRRYGVTSELERSSASQRMNVDKESNYEITRRLYDDAIGKLEQARVALEVASRGADQFIVLDPAYVPLYPSKPNRIRISLGSLGAGLLLGILAMLIAELLDTKLRTPKDLEMYHRPVVALLPERRGR